MSWLDALSTGLRAAGGTLSPEVYQDNANQASNAQAQDAHKKQFLAELLHKHYSEGTLSAQGYQSGMAKLGIQLPPLQETPDYASGMAQVNDMFDNQQKTGKRSFWI